MAVLANKQRAIKISSRQILNAVFIGIGAVAVFLVFDAIIGGKCDSKCVIGTLNQAIRYAAPVALAAYCGLMCERAAVINIGIEGMMLTAAMVGYGVNVYAFTWLKAGGMDPALAGDASRWLSLLLAIAASGLMALLHGVVSIRFKADQIISGTVINILALGITGYFYRQYLAQDIPPGPGTFAPFDIPLLAQIPILGPIVFQGQKPIVYFMMIVTLLIHYVLFFTPWGLRTRAVGENPRAADTLGINVFRVRYINVLLGGALAGFAGAWFTLEAVDVFNPQMTNGLGFIGLAAMIFGNWSPFGALAGALIFGLGNTITTTISIFRPDIPSQIPQMLPYVLTILVLTGFVGRAIPPAADGQPYEKQ
ncbi:MAG: ABC transporter permease [Chloroflexi bacterium]|nr:ABC transporter permease [Chloroflexota bacterium]